EIVQRPAWVAELVAEDHLGQKTAGHVAAAVLAQDARLPANDGDGLAPDLAHEDVRGEVADDFALLPAVDLDPRVFGGGAHDVGGEELLVDAVEDARVHGVEKVDELLLRGRVQFLGDDDLGGGEMSHSGSPRERAIDHQVERRVPEPIATTIPTRKRRSG